MTLERQIALAGLLLCLLVVAAVGGAAYSVVSIEVSRNLRESMEARAARHAAELNYRLLLIDNTLRSLSRNQVIVNGPIDSEGRELYLMPFLRGFRNIDNIPVEITLTDFQGKPIVRTRDDHVFDSARSWVRETLEAETPRATIIEYEGLPYLLTAYLVTYARTRSIEGAFVAIVPLNHLRPAGHDPRVSPFAVSLEWRGKPKSNVHRYSTDPKAAEHADVYELTLPLTVSNSLARLGFTVRVAAPKSEVFARWYRLSQSFLIGGLVITLFVTLLCFWGGRRLTRPLRELETFARSVVSADDFDHRLPQQWKGEIGQLGKAFNEMLDRIALQGVRQRASEAALRESESRFRALIDNAPMAIHLKDSEGRYVVVNAEFNSVFAREALGKTAREVFSSEVASSIGEAENKMLELGQRQTFEATITTLDNTDRQFIVTKFPIADSRGVVTGIGGITVDITSSKQLQEQLFQSHKMDTLGQLTGGIAHDFNNLLTVILGNAETLVEDLGEGGEQRELAEIIFKAAERGAELTSRLLAFARRQALAPKRTDVGELISGMDGLLRRTLGGEIEIHATRVEALWHAFVDASQLESSVLNLCINARDAMPKGGRLTLELANVTLDGHYADWDEEVIPGEYVMLAVSDTGAGMPSEVLSRVFEPFFTTKELGKGSGLGLSMVFGFIKQSGGHIKIYSELGQGTVVKLYLPRAQGEGGDATPGTHLTEAQHGSERILLVEDDDLVRRYVKSQLEILGYDVVTSGSAASAIEILRQTRSIDLLFTDIVMPGGLDGRQLANEARKLRPDLPVLFTSGFSENGVFHHGRIDPSIHLISKPYRRADLARKIRIVLEGADGANGKAIVSDPVRPSTC
jgi:PAS domain S-box-containing protein